MATSWRVAVGGEEKGEGELLGDRVVGGWHGNGRERKTRGNRERVRVRSSQSTGHSCLGRRHMSLSGGVTAKESELYTVHKLRDGRG